MEESVLCMHHVEYRRLCLVEGWSKAIGSKVRIESCRRFIDPASLRSWTMQRFSVFHFLLCLGLVAGQEPCTVESKRSANTHQNILIYCGVLHSYCAWIQLAFLAGVAGNADQGLPAWLWRQQDFRQKKCDFIRREMEGGHKASQEVTTLIGRIA